MARVERYAIMKFRTSSHLIGPTFNECWFLVCTTLRKSRQTGRDYKQYANHPADIPSRETFFYFSSQIESSKFLLLRKDTIHALDKLKIVIRTY